MQHDKELRNFLEDYINIDSKRLENARDKVSWEDGALTKYLENNLWETFTQAYQWSFAYETIIKPDPETETGKYDVDLAIRLNYKEDREWEEYRYHELILNCLKNSDRYKDKLDETKERAIRIQYDADDGEFYVDLVPMFHDWDNWNVIDRKNNVVEISGWNEFKDWVNKQNNKTSTDESTAKFWKESIRIYKYLRNQSNPDLIRSVQLTLLLARQIDKLPEEAFETLSSTFYWISQKLKEELESINYLSELDLSNPWLSEEIFDRKFTEEDFQEFKEWFVEITEKIEEAYNETDEETSIKKRQDIFGEDFGYEKIDKNIYALVNYTHARDPEKFWTDSTNKQTIKIIGTHNKKSNWKYFIKPISFHSHWSVLPWEDLSFYATNLPTKLWDTKLFRQVTNEWNEHVKNKRGEITERKESLWYNKKYKWYGIKEESLWKWRHRVKCYLVNTRKERIAESNNFYVNIL